MIHELRIYTVKAGTVGEMAKHSAEVGRAIRGDNYGKLEGYWITEIGPLNQVCHLWSFKDLNERARLKAELGKNADWNNKYLPLTRPILVRQDVRILNPLLDIRPPASTGNIYELRYYRLKPGTVREWAKHFSEALPIREKYSEIVGLWQTEAGQPNEVCHLWSYPDLNARAAARGGVSKDPAWAEFLKKGGGMLEEMHNMIMLPASHSPMK